MQVLQFKYVRIFGVEMEKKDSAVCMCDKARKRIFELGGQNSLALLSKIVTHLALEINVRQGSCLNKNK